MEQLLMVVLGVLLCFAPKFTLRHRYTESDLFTALINMPEKV